MMSTEQLQELYEHLATLAAEGKESNMRSYLIEKLPEMPEELQDEITFQLFADATMKQAQELETVEMIQQESLDAAEILQYVKTELEKGGVTAS